MVVDPSIYVKVCGIVENLDNLIPVGTLTIHDFPKGNFDYCGIKSPDRWTWLNLPFIQDICRKENDNDNYDVPLLKCLRFLLDFKYIRCTYKLFQINDLQLVRIRVYAVPGDVKGFRFINTWRKRFRIKNVTKNWRFLIELLDFSSDSWYMAKPLNEMLLVPYTVRPSSSSTNNCNGYNFHLDRWHNGKPYSMSKERMTPSLITRIQKLYGSITSPQMAKYATNAKFKLFQPLQTPRERLESLVSNASNGTVEIDGLKARMYSYQVISLARMYEKEAIQQYHHLPGLLDFKDCSHSKTPYYVHINTFVFYRNPDLIRLPRGGILAENMGLGKTLICLALVCLTKNDITETPEDLLLYRQEDSKSRILLKSLVNTCVLFINDNSMPWKYFINEIPPQVIQRLGESPGSFKLKIDYNNQHNSVFDVPKRRSYRKKESVLDHQPEDYLYRNVYHSSTTLVVVPENLIHQWSNELAKHVHHNYLKKLFVSSHFSEISGQFMTFMNDMTTLDPLQLIQYDLIIISNQIFGKLFNKPENPLLKVYWKRLIIDEGHSINSKNSRTSLLCKDILAERKWAVTGTPTSGLTNIYVDEEEEEQEDTRKSKYVIKNTFDERNDLAKLGNIVSNFLKVEPFHSQLKSWTNLIVKPLISGSYNAEQALYMLINNLMVRHNPLDISDSLVLPQLHHEVVYLQPSFHNKLSINLFAAVLAVNAVTSERTGIDYMFHPSNRMQLRRLITNLQRATFHWTGFTQKDVETLIKICRHALKKKKPDGSHYYTVSDNKLLIKSMEIAKTALSNSQWRSGALLHEMSYYINGLPLQFAKYFGVSHQPLNQSQSSVFGAPHLNAIQDFVYKNRFTRFQDIQQFNELLDPSSRVFWDRYWNDSLKSNDNKFSKQGSQKKPQAIMQAEIISAINIPEIVEGFKPQYMVDETAWEYDNELSVTQDHKTDVNDLTFEKLRKAIVSGTASAKLSYLGARLLEHKLNKDKSIVFYEFEDSAYYLTELLDILGVQYILYATFNKPEQRAQNLSEFSLYDSNNRGGIALIMDLKLASHGLTIISASRVYFLSPVWKTSVEAQAIKRAHRIGQTKEVHVETLVLRDTLEEEIYNLRSSHRNINNGNDDDTNSYEEQTNDNNHAIDDLGVQNYVLKHEFLDFEASENECCGFQAPAISEAIDTENDDDDPDSYSLLNHQLFVNKLTRPHIRQWLIYLCNQDNLEKLTRSKSQKILDKESKKDFMKSFITECEEAPHVNKRPLAIVSKNKRKRVRF
ncbi:uncharacterized protein KQ657_004547 [Scheffersomyces spartinae]|uniref:Uncharacterized protein n=1 Tax=Scheffersomyces spartinae TaxID=45513 RepID=A0A9P7VAT7_9ASCO|nr:uncharacterized protein KQ657_004547 [Scheffersomyces spartinae]KAG7194335.1 hypothetical protein KQ657_004547 [Scheffersomyces spartinae]